MTTVSSFRRLARMLKRIFLAIACAAVLAVGAFCVTYAGLLNAMFTYVRYSSVGHLQRLSGPLAYWVDFAGRMKLDAAGFYTFDAVDDENLDEFDKGRVAFHNGRFPRSVTAIERSIQEEGESETRLFWLAIAYMRRAEAVNCLAKLVDAPEHASHDMAGMCSLPLARFHDKAADARTSARLFEKLLDNYDSNNGLYRWLLNFNYMVVNGYPQQVPPKYLIQTKFTEAFYGPGKRALEAEFADLVLEDKAQELGTDTYNTGRGAAVEDFDKDGYLDLVTAGAFETLHYLKNEGGEEISDQTEKVGLAGLRQPFFISAVDYDNDGWMDLFVTRMFGPKYVLLRNNQHGGFIDVTAEAGLLDGDLATQWTSGWVSAWGDVNNDGYLDLFVSQMSMKVPFSRGMLAAPRMDSKLFINQKGHFSDKTKEYGVAELVHDSYFIGAAFGDYDRDGYPDLFVSSPLWRTSALFRNVSGTRFEKTNLIDRKEGGFSAAFLDVNHDGRLDLFQGGFADARSSTEGTALGTGASVGEIHARASAKGSAFGASGVGKSSAPCRRD